MPKSKRAKLITLARTAKKGKERKSAYVDLVRDCIKQYNHIWLFDTQNMRTKHLKELRGLWSESRFFFGKNRLIQIALGRTEEEEYKTNLHLLSQSIQGNCGLLFTNKHADEVIDFFSTYKKEDYARSGFVAIDTVTIQSGTLTQFSHSLEPWLRQQGMPTRLNKGIIELKEDYTISTKGDILTPEQARLLQLFELKQSTFKVIMKGLWYNDTYHITPHAEEENIEDEDILEI